MWQDYVIAVVGLLFGFMMFPQIRDSLKGKTVNAVSAGLTMLGLFVLGFTFASLDLWLSVASEFFSGGTWLVLFVLSVKENRKNAAKEM